MTGDITLYAKWICAGEHTYDWQSENGQYWKKCSGCGHKTTKKDIPEIVINGADKVHRTQDYTFSITLPENVNANRIETGYAFEHTETPLDVRSDMKSGETFTSTLPVKLYRDGENTFISSAYITLEDGFKFFITKNVKIVDGHDGTADCTHKAKCEVCGEEYGEVDGTNHTTLKHTEAKAATTEADGNIEY